MASHKPWRIAFEGQYGDGTELVNVMHVLDTALLAPDLSDAATIASEVNTWLGLKWRNCAFGDVTLTDIKATSEVLPPDVPEQAIHSVNLAGTLGSEDGKGSHAMCLWSKASTGVPIRGAHGGWHTPPWNHSAFLNSAGQWLSSSGGWSAAGDMNTTLLAGHDYGIASNHLSYIIFSRTRFKRGESTYYFDVTAMTRDPLPHFLRSRLTTP